ncbi:Hcp family type VI secretion system effector [Rhodoferax saidenbachensis]|uniref:Virulence factor secretion apparatus protein n=1 Tax=Rhodoferax saidenbachensis TaxID=1484693 RepID=A0A1P8KEM5_9BURK|nr:type VI secretion system tube protein Hcp [Rhodoferax saidenbachensis]APW44421.1 hypothetical protein RS694_19120 [Rhodoferax saidenbachensis]
MIFLKIESIKGQSTVAQADYTEAIEVDSYSFGVSKALLTNASNQERQAGEVNFSEMTFSKTMDQATNMLVDACAKGTALGDVEVHVTRTVGATEELLVKYVLFDALISTVSSQGSSGGQLPFDSFSINFTKITGDFTGQKTDSTAGGVSAFEYDLRTKEAGAAA